MNYNTRVRRCIFNEAKARFEDFTRDNACAKEYKRGFFLICRLSNPLSPTGLTLVARIEIFNCTVLFRAHGHQRGRQGIQCHALGCVMSQHVTMMPSLRGRSKHQEARTLSWPMGHCQRVRDFHAEGFLCPTVPTPNHFQVQARN